MFERVSLRQRGYVMVSVALLLPVLCGFAALAVDLGMLMSARAAVRRAADAGALAGAFTFVVDPTSPQPATAEQHATSTAQRIANVIFFIALLQSCWDREFSKSFERQDTPNICPGQASGDAGPGNRI